MPFFAFIILLLLTSPSALSLIAQKTDSSSLCSSGQHEVNPCEPECHFDYGETASTITGCESFEKEERLLYSPAILERLRQLYSEVRKSHPDEMGPIADTGAAYVTAGMAVPFIVEMVPGTHYRGIFAAKDIPKATGISRPGYVGTFLTEASWLEFLNSVSMEDSYGRVLACDLLQWCYVVEAGKYNEETCQWDGVEGQFMVSCDLDENSFTNHGGEEANVIDFEVLEELGIAPLGSNPAGMCHKYSTYARRDIKAGEELKMDYLSFIEFGALEWFEASVAKAWNVDRSLHDENQWHFR